MYANWKERKPLAAALRPIVHRSERRRSAPVCLTPLSAGRGACGSRPSLPPGGGRGRRSFRSLPFPPDVRRVIYTTNAIESVNSQLRKIIKTRGHFPNDDAANKLMWLALRNITADGAARRSHWKEAMNQFAILYDDRFTARNA